MEKQLEHKIKEAYNKKDANATFGGKDQLWGHLSNGLGHSKGVAAIWRVAAIILALLSFGGVFGVVNYVQKSQNTQNKIQKQLVELQNDMDSISSRKPEKVVETITVEKEKIVYREIESKPITIDKIENNTENLENRILDLTQMLQAANIQLQETKNTLEIALAENDNLSKTETIVEEKGINFKLKTERVKDQIQPDKKSISPNMKLQLFKIQDNMKYNSDATLFKK